MAPNETSKPATARKMAGIAVALAIIAAVILALQFLRSKSAAPARISADLTALQKSIAVLPLLNESGDPGDEYFSDGLSEELIAALTESFDRPVNARFAP